MPLHLVTGPANSGKAGRVLAEHRARLADGAILVVPTTGDVERAEHELAARGAVLGPRVLSFAGLVGRVAERLGLPAGPGATPLQRELVMAAALRVVPLGRPGPPGSRPGVRRAALRLVAELERAGVEPAAFSDGLARWAAAAPGLGGAGPSPHVWALGPLYAEYRRRLDAAGLTEPEVLARRAVDALRAAPGRLEAAPVYVHGFDDFTELELDLLEVVAGPVGAPVTVSLPFEPGREAFRAVAPVAGRLLALAASHEHLQPSAAHYADGSRAALHHLERRLFAPEPEPVEPEGAVLLLESGGERAEVELVGARVLALLEAGTPPGEVAMVFRDPVAAAPLVESVFDSYGIPWAADPRGTLGHTALGRGLLALLRCSGPGGEASDLLTHLRSPGRLRRPELADRLEARLRVEGVVAAQEAAERWEELAWPLDDRRALGRADSPRALVVALERALDRLWAAPRRRAAAVLGPAEREDARAYVAAREALNDLAALGDDAGLDREGVHDLLAGVAVAPERRPRLDAVQLASPEGVRARRFSAVFVCGLQEGEFPRSGAAEALLPDDERRVLATVSGLHLPLRADDGERERYLFYVSASRAERLLALSVRTSDGDGAPVAPSPLLDDVRALFSTALVERRLVRSPVRITWPEHEAPSEVERARARAAAERGSSAAEPAHRLTDPGVLDFLAQRPAFSAGALEVYGSCPVRWLVERVLRAGPLEPDPEALVRGSLAHEVLELTYRRLAERTGSARVTSESLPEAERLLAEALEERGPAHRISPSASRAGPAVRRLEADLVRHLQREAATPGHFEPAELELSFGMGEGEGEHPALDLGEVRIRGRIDRVDTCGSRAVVRDYKSGRRAHPAARWEEEGRLQAPLYLLAVRELLGLEPVGALYVPLAGDEKPRGAWLDELEDELGSGLAAGDRASREEIDAHLETARHRACELAGRLRTGDVRPSPHTCHPRGGGCAYPSICREDG